jgi:hypothetical protein
MKNNLLMERRERLQEVMIQTFHEEVQTLNHELQLNMWFLRCGYSESDCPPKQR